MPPLRYVSISALELRLDAQMPRMQNNLEASTMNKEIAKAVDMLKSVLCDAEGRASISGTNEDRAEIDEALSILSSAHVVDAEPVAEQYLPVATVFAGRKDGGGWQNRAFCLQEIFGEEQAKIGLQDVKVGSVLYAKEENLTTAAPSNTATVQIDEKRLERLR